MAPSLDSSAERRLEAAERLVSEPDRVRTRFTWGLLLTYIVLSMGAVIMVVPFVWMILTSLKPATELVQFAFLPKNPTLANYVEVLNSNSFGRWYFNSVLIAVISTATVAFFDTLVGYTLNKFEFPGKNLIFVGILATLMVPTEMLIIPWFNMSVQLGWNTGPAQYWGIVFPGVIRSPPPSGCWSLRSM